LVSSIKKRARGLPLLQILNILVVKWETSV